MKELKKISTLSVPSALKKAERYRLLNDPSDAESICHDILDVDPENNDAKIMLILSLSDQLAERMAAFQEAQGIVNTLTSEYERYYYMGLLNERRARAHFRKGAMGCEQVAYNWFQVALALFDKAAGTHPPSIE